MFRDLGSVVNTADLVVKQFAAHIADECPEYASGGKVRVTPSNALSCTRPF